MSTSVLIDNDEWITGAVVIGDTGGGVIAESIAMYGANGPSLLGPQLSFPADAGKEVTGIVTAWPTAGTLIGPDEYGRFSYSGPPTSFQFQLYVEYQPIGTPQTINIVASAPVVLTTGLSAVVQQAKANTASLQLAVRNTPVALASLQAYVQTGQTVASAVSAAVLASRVSTAGASLAASINPGFAASLQAYVQAAASAVYSSLDGVIQHSPRYAPGVSLYVWTDGGNISFKPSGTRRVPATRSRR